MVLQPGDLAKGVRKGNLMGPMPSSGAEHSRVGERGGGRAGQGVSMGRFRETGPWNGWWSTGEGAGVSPALAHP